MNLQPTFVRIALLLAFPWVVGASDGLPPSAGSRPGERQRALLERFDSNADGRLDEAEKAAARSTLGGGPGGPNSSQAESMRERFLEAFDANGDGRLDEGERSTALDAILSDPTRPAARRLIQRFDNNGDGVIDAEEKEAALQAWSILQRVHDRQGEHGRRLMQWRRQAVMPRFDTNADGRLDEAERAAARAAWQAWQDRGRGAAGN